MEGLDSRMSVEAEMSVLGCMMLDDESAKAAVDTLAPEMFTHPALKAIFGKSTDLYWQGKKIDAVVIGEQIPEYRDTCIKLAQYVPTTRHLQEYMQIVLDDWRKRSIQQAMEITLCNAEAKSADEMTEGLREIVKQQDAITTVQQDGGTCFREAAEEFIQWLGSSKGDDTISTGYRNLDRAMGGFMRKSTTALCARSGHGKTDFALNLAVRMAAHNHKVQYFTMEMPTLQLMQRIASQLAHVDGDKIRDKSVSPEELQTTETVLTAFKADGKINFVDEAKVSLKTIRHNIDLYKPDVIFIDHIGLMERPNLKDQWRAVGVITNELKQIAKEKDIAIIELVQMNRQIEGRKDKKPNLGDIRESGDIEQDADYVMFVQSDDLEEKQIKGESWVDASIVLRKNRHGRPGTFPFHWQPQYHTFFEVENGYEGE